MDLQRLIDQVKAHADIRQAGMILTHNGIVRETSSDGTTRVSGLTVSVDHDRLADAVARHRQMPGIIDIVVEIVEDRPLAVGDDIMGMVVAGDVRDNVFAALQSLLDEVKSMVTRKTETPAD
ncbi:MAG: molybdenum cofactor biosynthesis protein MoaE [Desulfosudaceae bacterium]